MSEVKESEIPIEPPETHPLDWIRAGVFFVVVVASAAAWSFQFTSFLHAKELVLCIGIVVLGVLYAFRMPNYGFVINIATIPFFLALWLQVFTSISGDIFGRYNADILALHTGLLCALAWSVCDLLSGRFATMGMVSIVCAGAVIACLGLLQYAGLLLSLFPKFPGYDQPAYSVFGNQDLFGGYLAISIAVAMAITLRGFLEERSSSNAIFRNGPPQCHPRESGDPEGSEIAAPVASLDPRFRGDDEESGGFTKGALASWLTAVFEKFMLDGYRPWRWPCLVVLPLMLTGLAISMCRSAWLAAALGCLAAVPWMRVWSWLGALNRPRKLAMAAGFTLFLLVGPAFFAPRMADRVQQTFTKADVGFGVRWWLWNGAWAMFRENPWMGVGWGNYGLYSPAYLGDVLWAPGGERFYRNELHADNAHSEPLEYLAENGLLGLLVPGAILILFMRRIKKLLNAGPLPGSVVCGGLTALAVFACFNAAFDSIVHALAGLVLLLAGYSPAAGFTPSFAWNRSVTPKTRTGRIAGGVFFAILTVIFSVPYGLLVLYPSHLLRMAEDAHMARSPETEALYKATLAAEGGSYCQANLDYGIWLMDQGRFAEAQKHFDTALFLIDTGRIHLLRAICAQALDDSTGTYEAAKDCVWRWPENRQAWDMVLANAPHDRLEKLRARRARWLGE